MLNEERIILMTKLASYEAGEGKRNTAVGSYFRSDYIGLQVIKSAISATVTFMIFIALFVLYDFEAFMLDIYRMDLFVFAKNILLLYGGVVISFSLLTYVIYAYRYNKTKKSLKNYYNNLRKLSSLYEKNRK
ncbi:MAG TPA: hypothetical protein VJY54_10265 [Lachnospiraceae bacterium]|nr:hypothetical protein [Lachnospiraceae bacterium]